MPSFEELAKSYALRIRRTIPSDLYERRRITEQYTIRNSALLKEILAVRNEIANLVYLNNNAKISEADKKRIMEGVAEELGLRDSKLPVLICNAADNSNTVDLVTYITSLLEQAKK